MFPWLRLARGGSHDTLMAVALMASPFTLLGGAPGTAGALHVSHVTATEGGQSPPTVCRLVSGCVRVLRHSVCMWVDTAKEMNIRKVWSFKKLKLK